VVGGGDGEVGGEAGAGLAPSPPGHGRLQQTTHASIGATSDTFARGNFGCALARRPHRVSHDSPRWARCDCSSSIALCQSFGRFGLVGATTCSVFDALTTPSKPPPRTTTRGHDGTRCAGHGDGRRGRTWGRSPRHRHSQREGDEDEADDEEVLGEGEHPAATEARAHGGARPGRRRRRVVCWAGHAEAAAFARSCRVTWRAHHSLNAPSSFVSVQQVQVVSRARSTWP
jgi:hypothetical protein